MPVKKITCSHCGNLSAYEKHYSSKNEKNQYYGKMTLCKDCTIELFNKIYDRLRDRKEAIIEFCSLMDIPFSESIYDMSANAFATRGENEEYKLATTYLSFINSNVGKSAGEKFSDSENFNRLFNEGGEVNSNLQFKFERAEEEIMNLTEHIKDLELEKATISKEISILKPENLKLQTRLTASETEVTSLKISNEQELARKEGLKIKLESEIARLSSELDITKRNLSDIGKKLKEKTDECDTLQKTVNSFNKQSLVLGNDAEYATKKLNEYTDKKEKEIAELNEKHEEDVKKLKNRVTELLVQLEDEKNSNKIIDAEINVEKIPEEYIFEWGEGFELKDYEFMDKRAKVWRDKHEIITEAKEVLLKEIVIQELLMRKQRAVGNDPTKEQKVLRELIGAANFVEKKSVNSFSQNGEKDNFGEWIKDIEDNSPAEWYNNQNKFKDIEGLEPYIKKHITRSLKNFVTGSRDFDSSMDLLSGDDSSSE